MRIYELRRNPEKNIRQNVYQFLLKYKDDPSIYIHTNDIDKIGINPHTPDSHDSPMGIYAFNLTDIWDSIEPFNTGKYAEKPRGLEFIPYYGGENVFVLKSDIPHDTLKKYHEDDLNKDIKKLQSLYNISDEDMDRLKRAAKTNLNYVKAPIGDLWGITKSLAAGGVSEFDQYTPVNTKKWAYILRKLGYHGFNDPGYGFIHGAENKQTLFLNTSGFKVIDKFRIQKKRRVNVGDKKTYQSAPRKLEMQYIPNTFFLNHEPEQFKNLREWIIDRMEMKDISGINTFLPWNATAIIKQASVGTYVFDSAFSALTNTKKKIIIKTLFIDERDTVEIAMAIPKIPEEAYKHIGKIVINYTDDYDKEYLEKKIPEKFKNKFEFVNPFDRFK